MEYVLAVVALLSVLGMGWLIFEIFVADLDIDDDDWDL